MVALLAVGCGERSRTVHVRDARILFDIDRGDTSGRLLVDGADLASCSRRWWLPEIVCDVDAAVTSTGPLHLELVLDIGSAATEVDVRSLPPGRHIVLLDARAPLTAATVAFDVAIEPRIPWSTAIALAIVLAFALAYALYLILGARFASSDDAKPKGIATTIGRVLTMLCFASILPIASIAKHTEPVIVAIPTLLGGTSAAITILDAIVNRRLGAHRGMRIALAISGAATLPLIVAMFALTIPYAIVMVVVVMVIAGFV